MATDLRELLAAARFLHAAGMNYTSNGRAYAAIIAHRLACLIERYVADGWS